MHSIYLAFTKYIVGHWDIICLDFSEFKTYVIFTGIWRKFLCIMACRLQLFKAHFSVVKIFYLIQNKAEILLWLDTVILEKVRVVLIILVLENTWACKELPLGNSVNVYFLPLILPRAITRLRLKSRCLIRSAVEHKFMPMHQLMRNSYYGA